MQPETLDRMAAQLVHRGPDDSGSWISPTGNVGLCHRRLSIMDLSAAARQPFSVQGGGIQVVFNGEIYNFRELRKWLERRGHRFRSECDTEVLPYLYLEQGADMVHHLDGDFAFGIWDQRHQRLFLARDPVGVKPLYYVETEDRFVFASEIKALIAGGAIRPELDEESLYHYLTYLVVPAPRTLFRSVEKLPAGGIVSLDLARGSGRSRSRKYWRPYPKVAGWSDAEMDERLEELVVASVKKRLMSDVPVGVLFSGGVDSTLNAVQFSRLIEPKPVHTFTVGVSGAVDFEDEVDTARQRAAAIGAEHHEIRICEDQLLETMLHLVHHQGEPLADPVCVPLYFVTKLAKESGVTVLQAGEGADEIFCGYDNYRRFLSHERLFWNPLNTIPAVLAHLGYRALKLSRKPIHRKMAAVTLQRLRGQEFFLSSAVAYYEDEKALILSPSFKALHSDLDSFEIVSPFYEEMAREHPASSFLQRITYVELQLRLPELLLMRVDKMSMANSVEVRVPFLDRDLVEFALSVPDSYKLRKGVSKEPLKRMTSRFIPREIAYAPKRGFAAPIQSWFGSNLGARMREMLVDERADLEEYFDLDELFGRLDRKPRTVNEAFQLWTIFNFLVWRKEWLG